VALPDLFYADASRIGDFAKGQPVRLWRPGQECQLLPSLVRTFTYNGTFQCAPKDYSTLDLAINTGLWKAAGLTMPTSHELGGLEKVAASSPRAQSPAWSSATTSTAAEPS